VGVVARSIVGKAMMRRTKKVGVRSGASTKARAVGESLVVSFASAEVLWRHTPLVLPDRRAWKILLQSLRMVDQIVVTQGPKVTEDDRYGAANRDLCEKMDAQYSTRRRPW
jgi:hypothetical protein